LAAKKSAAAMVMSMAIDLTGDRRDSE